MSLTMNDIYCCLGDFAFCTTHQHTGNDEKSCSKSAHLTLSECSSAIVPGPKNPLCIAPVVFLECYSMNHILGYFNPFGKV